MKHNVVIVDDHNLIANALSGIINNFKNFEVIYTCENGQDFKDKIKVKGVPKIVLLDVSMPIMDGFETAEWLTKEYPEILIMTLSMQNDDNSLIRMIRNGAKGYMLKNVQPKDLENALEKLIEEGHYFPIWASRKIYTNITDDSLEANSKVALNDREREFLKYTATELSYKEIADKMCCSPRTLENYRDKLFTKLDIKSRVGLAIYALKNGYAT